MKSLVTGGAGFIGSHLVERLLSEGDDVFVLDNLSTGTLNNLDEVSRKLYIEIASVEDYHSTESVIRRFKPDRIFHLAAQVSVPNSVSAPIGDFQSNAMAATVIFEAAAKHGVKKIVFSSTGGAIYGEAKEVPTPETHPALPMSPYGQHKLLAETGAGFYFREKGIQITTLRFANVYGPRQGGSGESGVISLFTGAAVDEKPVTVYGSGEQTRDFVYVGDVVDALILASEVENSGGPYNIGTQGELTINDLIGEIEALGLPITYRYAKEREGEVQRSSLLAGKASDELGWRAKTPFAEGLSHTIEQMKQHPRDDKRETTLCFDVGGATVSWATISDTGPIKVESSERPGDVDALMDFLAEKVGEERNWALALPGTVSGKRYWSKSSAYNIMNEVVDLQEECLARNIATPSLAENDVFVLARGSSLENLAIKRLAVLNLGYGVGGALSMAGWPEKGIAQEIGHIPLPANNELCSCGQRGCISTKLSWGAISEKTGFKEPAEIRTNKEIYQEARDALIFLLSTVKIVLSPEATMLSGGMFWGLWEEEIDDLEAEVARETLSSPGAKGILLAASGPEVALKGVYDLAGEGNYPR